jgi:hypothetical protein
MEAVAYFIIAVVLVAAGCVATVLSVYVVPLWIRVRGQGHGRFAGLSAAQTEPVSGGSKRMVGGPGQAIGEPPAPAAILA